MRTIKWGERFPFGLSRCKHPEYAWAFCLRIPLAPWYMRKRYSINTDAFLRGWFLSSVFLRLGVIRRFALDVRVAFGWEPMKGVRET
jgi:hypothetical protein